jgi:hypothetical protein
MIHETAIIDVRSSILERATKMLEEASYGLTITAIDVTLMQAQTPTGPQPAWGIYYYAKGMLLGDENSLYQVTAVILPNIDDERLKKALQDGCALLREARAKQGNGLRG